MLPLGCHHCLTAASLVTVAPCWALVVAATKTGTWFSCAVCFPFFRVRDYSTFCCKVHVFRFSLHNCERAVLHFHVNKLVAFRDFHFVFLYVFTHVYTCTSVSHCFCQELTSPQQRELVAPASCCGARFRNWEQCMFSTYEFCRDTHARTVVQASYT